MSALTPDVADDRDVVRQLHAELRAVHRAVRVREARAQRAPDHVAEDHVAGVRRELIRRGGALRREWPGAERADDGEAGERAGERDAREHEPSQWVTVVTREGKAGVVPRAAALRTWR